MTTVNLASDNATHSAIPGAVGVAMVTPSAVALVGGNAAVQQPLGVQAMSAPQSTPAVTGNDAVTSAIHGMLAQATPAAQARFALLQAKTADKSATGALWSGLLALAAEGAGPAVIRATGAALRRDATRALRVLAGFSADKVKGAKESGAPDYSTASVYAGIVAGCLEARRDNVNLYDAAIEACAGEQGIMMDECGVPLAKNDAARVLKDFTARNVADQARAYPMLAPQVNDSQSAMLARVTVERDTLATDLASANEQIAALKAQLAQAHATA